MRILKLLQFCLVTGSRCYDHTDGIFHEITSYITCVYFRYYKKFAVVKEKQKRNADEDSIEDVDDEEFEKMIGN